MHLSYPIHQVVRRWLVRAAIASAPVVGIISCGGSDFVSDSTGASGAGMGGPTGSGSGSGGSSASTGAAGATTVGSGGVATGGSAGAGTGGAGGADAGPRDGGGGAGGGAGGPGGQGGAPSDGSVLIDGRCISGEGGPCGGFIANPCTCQSGLACVLSGIPDTGGTCRKPDSGTGDAGQRVCISACDRCVGGVCCGAGCCGHGEWCDESSSIPTCRCGANPACVMPNTCEGIGPSTPNGCGLICCSNNCPQ